ncbi:urease accessory protein [Chitinophaga niastensis]|uniref:Urease accessory protein UreD n=1 Tax=Chitinophaga niastensis TaxID=536980 RepID=A0A2P8HB56_CHINA|nr:urease accessory protein UreD [Chitinophaga niastensis]PSL43447.1 urease accessory protein [Chitinophaga niastensis]
MISELKILTGKRTDSAHTYLKESYCTRPFKIANVREDRTDPVLRLMMMSSSPGMLDKDHYQLDITVAAGTSLHLQTQAYQRLFSMETGAQQQMTVRLQPRSTFTFLPHPLVPHENATYTAHTDLHLAVDCRLIWSEIITCGRKLNGEVFLFSKLHSITQVYHEEQLLLRDNLLMQPGLMDFEAMGWMEGYTHQATFLFFDTHTNTTLNEITDRLHRYLDTQPALLAGVSRTHGSGVMVRLLGQGGEQLHACLQQLVGLLSS